MTQVLDFVPILTVSLALAVFFRLRHVRARHRAWCIRPGLSGSLAHTAPPIWAGRYARDLSDVFAVQDEITASVATIIEPALAEAEQHRALRKAPSSLDAWEAYQRGLWHFYRYSLDDNKTAQTFFRRAMEIDPAFAPGHYGFAFAQHLNFC